MIESRSLESLPRTCRGGEHCCRPEKPCPEEGGNDLFPGFPICTPLIKVHFIGPKKNLPPLSLVWRGL